MGMHHGMGVTYPIKGSAVLQLYKAKNDTVLNGAPGTKSD